MEQIKYRVIEKDYKIIEQDKFPVYWNHSVLKPRNFYETGLEESLEKIVLENDPIVEQASPREKLFADKGKTLQATIKALFNQILTREKLNYTLLKKIDSDVCKAGTYLEEMRIFTSRDYSRQFDNLGRRRTQIEERITGLEKEKRQEYLACWKDLAYLTKGILSALKDYWGLRNSNNFLDSDHDDGRGRNLQEAQAYPWQKSR